MAGADELDVATILETLRAEVHALRVAHGEGEVGSPLSAIERELHHCAEQLEITRVVSAHWPLEGGNLYERGWALVHKVVRRGLKWYIPPIVEQQNAFNDASARAIRLLIEAHAELRDQVADLSRRLDQEQSGAFLPLPEPASGSAAASSAAAAPPAGESADVATDLQARVERAGRAEPPAPLPDLGLRPLPVRVGDRAQVSAHWDLGGHSALTRARALVQRGIRQYLRWMVNPLVEQQNSYNTALAATLPQLLALDGELRARVAAARGKTRGRP